MDSSANLDPSSAPSSSSRQAGYARAASVNVYSSSTPQSQSTSGRHRASHQVVTSSQQQSENQQNDRPAFQDVYSHPAAVAYAASHPRRTIPKFGPYLLLQTLGEGEFGKVKLGLHSQWGEEVAVKLIRRGNIDSSVRMSKVEREIEVLRTLKHPNIVRLYDVIETDKYIGIILEYASGGELFDHILAHRYLKEKDACKLFSQLISGVWYIHQKKIVHRDLKLENLLLDRHRNVIITDFGFANRFEHRADDLMQTSCGSPCYAAPELVISEGLYVGSAVDIWSCGVILYAMLAGYLPFDDDPDNPDGDNINLLYKYIVTTTLTFPSHISPQARDLLSLMLVADPAKRADLLTIMRHEWLAPYAHLFRKSVDELERSAMDQQQMKRLAYQRQMRQAAGETGSNGRENGISRSQSARTGEGMNSMPPPSTSSRRQPEYLYETSSPTHEQQSVYQASPAAAPATANGSRRGYNSAMVLPSGIGHPGLDEDPFAPAPGAAGREMSPHTGTPDEGDLRGEPRPRLDAEGGATKNGGLTPQSAQKKGGQDGSVRKAGGFRHTIQVEYGEGEESQSQERASKERNGASSHEHERRHERRPSVDSAGRKGTKPLPAVPGAAAAPQRNPSQRVQPPSESSVIYSAGGAGVGGEEKPASVTGSQRSGHRRGLSMEKLGLGKIFSGSETAPNGEVPSSWKGPGGTVSKRPSTLQAPPAAERNNDLLSPSSSSDKDRDARKSRRNTLTVMVEPISRSIKSKTGRGRTPTTEQQMQHMQDMHYKDRSSGSFAQAELGVIPNERSARPTATTPNTMVPPTPTFANASRSDIGSIGLGMQASSSKARRVMQWFRSKSKGRPPTDDEGEVEETPISAHPEEGKDAGQMLTPNSAAAANSQKRGSLRGPAHVERTASTGTYSFTERVRRSVGVVGSTPSAAKGVLRVHHGAVDQTTITTRAPPDVMKHVKDVLENMGVEIQMESDYKYRCIRAKRRKGPLGPGVGVAPEGLTPIVMHGSAASNGVDKRGLPVPSHTSFTSGGMLRGLLMRRQSSQVSSVGDRSGAIDPDTPPETTPSASVLNEPTSSGLLEPIYGDRTQDHGDEVRFSVELTRIDRLNDTFSLDIRRLKGNLRSYKFLYDTLRNRADLQR